ncbi:hypothetical protein [Trueperella bernardiae]|uniref:hypothetical protein n=1 Tax=Trueperella bernardiae TaxID=59561 RepID=UPI00288B8EB6|nr:hypothetical protein [Trueperella bernardiae]
MNLNMGVWTAFILSALLLAGVGYALYRREPAGSGRPRGGAKMELEALYDATLSVFICFAMSVAVAYLAPESVDIQLFVSDDLFGLIQSAGREMTAWNSAAGGITLSVILAFAMGCIGAALSRTLLGAGMPRRQIFSRLSALGLTFTATFTALATIMWGLAALVERPVLTGVGPASLALIPVMFLLAYLGGLFVAALFVRFVWWVVFAGVAVAYAAATLISYIFPMMPSLRFWPAVNVGPSGAPMLALAAAAALWGMTWLLYRRLPMSRG